MVNAFSTDYWCPKTNSESPRYTVHIVDTAKDDLSQYSGQYGVFIVPIGKLIFYCRMSSSIMMFTSRVDIGPLIEYFLYY